MAKFDPGVTFTDGDTVTAASLNNIVDTLNIYSGLIADQTAIAGTVSTADLLLLADTDQGAAGAANKVTIQKLLNDALTNGTFTDANLSANLTYGTATGNKTVSTSAVITSGTLTTGVIPTGTFGTTTSTAATITNGTITNGTITTGLIPTLTAGTTTGTAGIFTSGTIATLNSTTGTIATLNSTTGTIGNLSTTLAGDFTISSGTSTLGTTGVTAGTYGTSTIIPVITVDTKGRVTSMGTSAVSAGKVLQVVQTVKSDSFSSVTKGTYVAVTGLSAAITTTSTSNKVLVTANVTASNQNNVVCMFHIYRNGSQITPDGVDTTITPSGAYSLFGGGAAGGAGVSMTLPLQFLDSPNTTSSGTYQIFAAVNSTAVANLNVNPAASAAGGSAGGNSSITLMEIAG